MCSLTHTQTHTHSAHICSRPASDCAQAPAGCFLHLQSPAPRLPRACAQTPASPEASPTDQPLKNRPFLQGIPAFPTSPRPGKCSLSVSVSHVSSGPRSLLSTAVSQVGRYVFAVLLKQINRHSDGLAQLSLSLPLTHARTRALSQVADSRWVKELTSSSRESKPEPTRKGGVEGEWTQKKRPSGLNTVDH